MVVLDYELNLSKTEYLYYLQCPQKFRIHRILNPLPDKTTFLNSKRTASSYFLRNYDGKNVQGIIDHSFFETFHRRYYDKITDPEPPEEIASNQIKLLFWKYQQKKYLANPDYWIPYKTELRLMSEKQRGIIDCLELCSNEKDIKIIDYKPIPQKEDILALFFYVNLLTIFKIEYMDLDIIPYNVIGIGCYYYELGFHKIFNLDNSNLLEFQNDFQNIIELIAYEKFPRRKEFCSYCNYYDLCCIFK